MGDYLLIGSLKKEFSVFLLASKLYAIFISEAKKLSGMSIYQSTTVEELLMRVHGLATHCHISKKLSRVG